MKRPACFHRQTGACRSCGLAVSQRCRGREEPVETTDAFRPTGGGRGAESGPSLMSNGESDRLQTPDRCPVTEAINSNRQTGVQRRKRSTSIAGRVSNGRRACHSNRRTGPRTKDQCQLRRLCPRCLLRRARSSPLRQHSLVGNRGRANHPPVMPVRQGSRTQVSMVGNLGESQTVQSLSTFPAPQKRACKTPQANCRQIVH